MPEAGRRWSIGRALGEAAERLERAGVGQPRREARALWAALSGATSGDVWVQADRAAPDALAPRFWEAVERRSTGIPFAYAVGRATFRHLDLVLDPRALIPRPETEGLVDVVLQHVARNTSHVARDTSHVARDTSHVARDTSHVARDDRSVTNVPRATCNVHRGVAADVGTGCGCLALALATEGAFERVVAIERSPDAAALARENVERIAPRVPVEVREGDLLAPLVERCAVIVANPPYLTEGEYAELDPAVREFEPREALVSGLDGLDTTRALLAGAAERLEPGGLLAIEIDERRAREVETIAREHGWRATVQQDVFGRERYLVATL